MKTEIKYKLTFDEILCALLDGIKVFSIECKKESKLYGGRKYTVILRGNEYGNLHFINVFHTRNKESAALATCDYIKGEECPQELKHFVDENKNAMVFVDEYRGA